jgi:hypothetical protein
MFKLRNKINNELSHDEKELIKEALCRNGNACEQESKNIDFDKCMPDEYREGMKIEYERLAKDQFKLLNKLERIWPRRQDYVFKG